jgi:hypothetical protein
MKSLSSRKNEPFRKKCNYEKLEEIKWIVLSFKDYIPHNLCYYTGGGSELLTIVKYNYRKSIAS